MRKKAASGRRTPKWTNRNLGVRCAKSVAGFGSAALFGQHLPEPVISKIRNAHDASAADPNHFRKHTFDIKYGLQRLGQDDAIELVVGKGAKAFIQVGLDDIEAPIDTGQDFLFIQLDADQAPMILLLETR